MFPAEATKKEATLATKQGEGETIREDRGFGSSERSGEEVTDRICKIGRLGVSVGRWG